MTLFRRTAYFRLFLIFLICLLVLEGVLLCLLSWSRSVVKNELNASTAANVDYMSRKFEEDFEHIRYQLECATQSTQITHLFTYYQTMSPAERYVAVRDAMAYLDSLYLNSQSIGQLYLYDFPLQLRLSAPKDHTISAVDKQTLEGLLSGVRSEGRPLENLDGDLTVNYMIPVSSYQGQTEPTYVLQAVISRSYILNNLSALNAPGDDTLFIHEPSGLVYSTSGRTDCAEQLLALPFHGDEVGFCDVEVDGRAYVAVGRRVGESRQCLMVQMIDAQKLYAFPIRLQRLTVIFTLSAFIVMALYLCSMWRMVVRPLHDLLDAFDRIGAGCMSTRLEPGYTDEFNRLSRHFNRMADQLETLIDKSYKQTILLQKAEMRHLQAQINPHFLYNSFYLLHHLVKSEDVEASEKLCRYLGDYFHYITDQRQDVLTLRQEYKHAMSYLNIQLKRFCNRLSAQVEEVPEECRDWKVPRLILQPLLENVLEHGIHENDDETMLRLSFTRDGALLHILVEDNGNILTDEKLSRMQQLFDATDGSHALNNIHQRLAIFYADPRCDLALRRSELGGLCACLTIKRQEEA